MKDEFLMHSYTVHAQHVVDGFVNFKVVHVVAANSSSAAYIARKDLMVELGAEADIRITSSTRLA